MCISLTPEDTASDNISSTTLTTSPVTSPATSSSSITSGVGAVFLGSSLAGVATSAEDSSVFALARAPARSSFGAAEVLLGFSSAAFFLSSILAADFFNSSISTSAALGSSFFGTSKTDIGIFCSSFSFFFSESFFSLDISNAGAAGFFPLTTFSILSSTVLFDCDTVFLDLAMFSCFSNLDFSISLVV